MNIHVYTDIHPLFGAGAMVWVRTLLAAGHEVEYIDLGQQAESALPSVGPCDVNIMVAGIYAFERFNKAGLPAHGRHLFWLLDPLTHDAASSHHYKAGLVAALAPRIDAVAAMDASVADWLTQDHPGLYVETLPYLVDERTITPPLPEADRVHDILWIGSDNARRRHAARLFAQAGLNAHFVVKPVWGAERDRLRREARIVLNIHADDRHTYFDQFRAFETWAAGSVVVAEHSQDLPSMGVIPGVHLATAPLEELPALCLALLADAPRRQAMTRSAQALLRQAFTPQPHRAGMLALVARTAGLPTP